MKRKIKDISFGTSYGDVAIQHALGEALLDLMVELKSRSENINEAEVDVTLLINGKEYNHEEFFKILVDHYFDYVKGYAEKRLIEGTVDAIDDLVGELNILRSKVESLRDNLDEDIRFFKRNKADL